MADISGTSLASGCAAAVGTVAQVSDYALSDQRLDGRNIGTSLQLLIRFPHDIMILSFCCVCSPLSAACIRTEHGPQHHQHEKCQRNYRFMLSYSDGKHLEILRMFARRAGKLRLR